MLLNRFKFTKNITIHSNNGDANWQHLPVINRLFDNYGSISNVMSSNVQKTQFPIVTVWTNEITVLEKQIAHTISSST